MNEDNRSLEEIQQDMARWNQRNYDIELVDYINELSETAQTPHIEAMQQLTEDINRQTVEAFNMNFDQNWLTRANPDCRAVSTRDLTDAADSLAGALWANSNMATNPCAEVAEELYPDGGLSDFARMRLNCSYRSISKDNRWLTCDKYQNVIKCNKDNCPKLMKS